MLVHSDTAASAMDGKGWFTAVAAVLLVFVSVTADANLFWRGNDLSAKGIHKGSGLPLFATYIHGLHSSFATQELSKDTPPWALFPGPYQQFYYPQPFPDDQGDNV